MDQPTAFFLVLSLVLSLTCLSILIPVFLPKYFQRHVQENAPSRPTSLAEFTGMSKYNFSVNPGSSSRASTDTTGGALSGRNMSFQDMSDRSGSDHHMRPSLNDGATTKLFESLSRQGSTFFASRPQSIRRFPSQGSKSDSTGSGAIKRASSGEGSGRYPCNVAKAAVVATATLSRLENGATSHSFTAGSKLNTDKKLLSTLSEHISNEESMMTSMNHDTTESNESTEHKNTTESHHDTTENNDNTEHNDTTESKDDTENLSS